MTLPLLYIFALSLEATLFYGVNCDLVWEPRRDWPEIVATLTEADVEAIRMPIRWTVAEPEKGKWSFTVIDEAIASIPENVEILATLMSVPAWANGVAPEKCEGWYDCYPPKDMANWAEFVRIVVKRYKHRIRHWEVWNEPNGIDFYRPHPDPVGYVEILKTAYITAKEADPDCLVVLGGLQMNGIIPNPWSPIKVPNFLEDLYKNGAKPYFDICNLHPYVLPDEGADYMMKLIRDAFQVMDKYGDAKKKLWITEVGAGINERDTAEDQARLLTDTMRLTRSEPRIERVFWFLLRDTEESVLGPEETMGLVTRAFEKRPAFHAFKSIIGEKPNKKM